MAALADPHGRLPRAAKGDAEGRAVRMSYSVEVRIYCDHGDESCANEFPVSQRNSGGLTKTWAAYLAARDGWWISGDTKIAYCPTHRAEHGKGPR
jgi:hypothetical protein